MQQNKMKIINTWKTYGLVNIKLLWLNLPHCFLVANFQVEETKLWTESIYRETSVMLPSLWAPLTCVAVIFSKCSQLEVLQSRGGAGWWAVAEVIGWGAVSNKMAPERRRAKCGRCQGWCAVCVSFCYSSLHLGVHSRSSLYPTSTHTRTQRTRMPQQPTWEELGFKALALSGSGWFGRHGGSWLLLVLLFML